MSGVGRGHPRTTGERRLHEQVIRDTLREVFPGGRFQFHAEDRGAHGETCYRIKRHYFVSRKGVKGNPTLEWWAGPPWHHKAVKLDECRLTTRNDLVGWAALLWEEVTGLALGALADELTPDNLFPRGVKQALRGKLRENIQVLAACGLNKVQVVEGLLRHLSCPWLPTRDKRKYAFKVNGAFPGAVVGRVSPRLASTSLLEWSYDIPISAEHKLKKRGEMDLLFPAAPDLTLTEVRVALEQLYVEALYEFVLRELERVPR